METLLFLLAILFAILLMIFIYGIPLLLIFCSYKIYIGIHKFYIRSYTFNSYVTWIFSYLLFFIEGLIFGYPYSFNHVLEFAFGYFKLLIAFVILFFLLRIEEKGLNHKYAKGILISVAIYLVSFICYSLGIVKISVYDSFYSLISDINILSVLLFIIYTLQIEYNISIKNGKIRYPIIFFGLPVTFLFTGSAIHGFYKTIYFFIYPIIIILFCSLFIFYYWLKIGYDSDIKQDNVNQSNKESRIFGYISKKISERKKRFYNREVRIEKSEYALNDEIRDAIYNSKYIELDNRDLKQLKFMLVCANREEETLKDVSNFAQNYMITGLTLMVVPLIIILISFFSYIINLQFDLIFNGGMDAFFNGIYYQIEQILSKFDSSTRTLIWFIFIYMHFLILTLFISLAEPNSKTNYWIRRSRKAKGVFKLFLITFYVGLIIMRLKSINFDIEDLTNLDISGLVFVATVLSFIVGLMLNVMGSLIISLNRKNVDNSNKIILDLNHKIIFYEK